MGARILNVQVHENDNMSAANAALADGSHGIDYMNFLKDLRALWQRAFETEVGATVEQIHRKVYCQRLGKLKHRNCFCWKKSDFVQQN